MNIEHTLKCPMKFEWTKYTYSGLSKYHNCSFGLIVLDSDDNSIVDNPNVKVEEGFVLKSVVDKLEIVSSKKDIIIKLFDNKGDLIKSTSIINVGKEYIYVEIFVRTESTFKEYRFKLGGN